jgi:beta-glucanase (GH16 family)
MMSRNFTTAIAVACVLGWATVVVAADPHVQTEHGLRLVWSDEFDADGPLNPDHWTYERGFVRNEELQWYQEQNAFCRDGSLVIEARRELVPNPRYDAKARDWRRQRELAEYTSACVLTRGKHEWQYGRMVMRGKIDVRPGLWPAFWTLGSARGWPGCGEIDVMEYYRGLLLANACWLGENRRPAWDDSRHPIRDFGPGWADEFHVWQLDWDAAALRLSVDGKLLNEVPLDRAINHDRRRSEPFHEPHYILLNLAIGGTQGGDPSDTELPARFEVDYVRVYQPWDESRTESH